MIKNKVTILVLTSYGLLCGCSTEVDNSVIEFVKETKNQKIEYKSELPQRPPIESVTYKPILSREPFTPFIINTAEKVSTPQEGPDLKRPREPLEAYPLDSLQMVGTIEHRGSFFALVKDRSGVVHRANIGNYIGQNSGKIVKISEKELEVQEWVSDGKGSFREQWSKLSLSTPHENSKGA